MLEVLYPPMLKEMSNYLEDEWLSAGQSQYSPYPQHVQQVPATTEAQNYAYNQQSYQQPKSIPTSYPQATPGFAYPNSHVQQQPYEGLDVVFSSLRSSAPGSGVSSPSLVPQPPAIDSFRGHTFGSPVPATQSRLLLSQSPVLNAQQPSHMLPSQSPAPATPRSTHLLPSQPVVAPLSNISQQRTSLKRPRDDDPYESEISTQRRRSRSGSIIPRLQTELSEEESLLLRLKHEESLPWKEIAREFETRLKRTYQVPALQMRYKRLRERLRTWSDDDVEALKAAHEYWEKSKFEIISQKMLEFGSAERWPARLCERKWEEIHHPFTDMNRLPYDEELKPTTSAGSPTTAEETISRPSPELIRTPIPNQWTYSGATGSTAPEDARLAYTQGHER